MDQIIDKIIEINKNKDYRPFTKNGHEVCKNCNKVMLNYTDYQIRARSLTDCRDYLVNSYRRNYVKSQDQIFICAPCIYDIYRTIMKQIEYI